MLLSRRLHDNSFTVLGRSNEAGLVVDEVIGFRRFTDGEFSEKWPETAVRCDRFVSGSYRRGEKTWPIFELYALLESNAFLQVSAE